MPVWYRLPTEIETLEAWDIIECAIESRRVIDTTYFTRMLDAQDRPRRFGDDRPDGELPHVARAFGRCRDMLHAAPVRRDMEPVRLWWTRDGNPCADVIRYACTGEELPAARTIRLDRIAVYPSGIRVLVTDRPCVIAGTGLDPTVGRTSGR
jgi:hypothetical protein